MAEMRVSIEGTVTTASTTGGTPATSTFTQITDGTGTAGVSSPPSGFSPALFVCDGAKTAVTTLNAVTANTTGTAVDGGGAYSNWSAIGVMTGSPTAGTLTLELSLDNVTFVSSTATQAITAAGNVAIFSTGRPARYARVSLSGLAGTISCTVKMMAGG